MTERDGEGQHQDTDTRGKRRYDQSWRERTEQEGRNPGKHRLLEQPRGLGHNL